MAMTNTLSGVQTAIAAAVNAITSTFAEYNYSLNADMGYGVPTLDKVLGKLPEIFLSDITEETISESGGTEVMRVTYTLVGIMNTDTSVNIGTDTMKLAADIQKAITTDQTLGTVVYRSKKETTEVVYYAEASKATVSLTFVSDYAVSTGTP
jgi:hypothetical protein